MKNNIYFLLLICFGLGACRTEESFENLYKEQNPKYFKVFREKDAPEINYAKGFKTLFQNYDSIQLSKNSIYKVLTMKYALKNTSMGRAEKIKEEVYIDFRFHSQVLKFDNEDVWMMFPVIEKGKVSKIAVAFLTEKRTKVDLQLLKPGTEYFSSVFLSFSEAYTKKMKASIASRNASNDDDSEADPNYKEIEEVVIVKPIPKNKYLEADVELYKFDETGGGSCADYNNCFPDSGGGGGNGGGDNKTQIKLPIRVRKQNWV